VSAAGDTVAIDGASPATDKVAAMVRQFEVEQFYFDEAALLDAHRYEEWVSLFTDDTHYFVPIRRTKSRRELADEFTRPRRHGPRREQDGPRRPRQEAHDRTVLVGRPAVAHTPPHRQRPRDC
jgi:hypothetical protein